MLYMLYTGRIKCDGITHQGSGLTSERQARQGTLPHTFPPVLFQIAHTEADMFLECSLKYVAHTSAVQQKG